MADRTLLIVDDDTEFAQLYKEMFTHRGWRVLHAADGDDAVEQALHHLPRVILLDLMLPKKGGQNVLQILKTMPETKRIPVIVVTAYPNPEYKDEAVSTGCDHFFSKTD